MYVYMCMYMYMYIHMYMNMNMYVYIYVCMCICVCLCICICICIWIWICMYIYVCMCICVCIYVYTQLHTTYAHTSVPSYNGRVTIEQPSIKAGDIGLCVREYRWPGSIGAASKWGSVSGNWSTLNHIEIFRLGFKLDVQDRTDLKSYQSLAI